MSNTLLIDNYDSFTYNLYALIAQVTSVPPIVVRNDEVTWQTLAKLDVDRIVISPGPGTPQRRSDLGLSADAILSSELPVLGVCLGHQAIAHLFGAKICGSALPFHGRLSRVVHRGEGLFEGLPSPFLAVRYHSLEVRDLPDQLRATAWTEDGVIMGLQHEQRPLWGVQFHPESICTEHGALLLRRFMELSPRRAPKPTRRMEVERAATVRRTRESNIRLFAERLDTSVDPADVFAGLYGSAPVAFWLDSSAVDQTRGRFSYMGDASGPRSEILRYRAKDDVLEITRRGERTTERENIFSYLQRRLATYEPIVDGAIALPFPFTGGYVGYFGYELKQKLEGANAASAAEPDACWLFADRFVAFDHASNSVWLMCLDDPSGMQPQNSAWMTATAQMLKRRAQLAPGASQTDPPQRGRISPLRWRHRPNVYRELILQAKEAIRQGESYEVCLTNQLQAECTLDPVTTYRTLRRVNPASYSAFLKFDDLAILCSSPELFLAISADGHVQSKPIKGTAPRSHDADEDAASSERLAHSEKDRAENLMIVDLLRNDLNRVCRTGSVHVPEIFAVESLRSVHQLVSTISGTLSEQASAIDCVRATFPGGSMTGAPKIRTMAILDRLEQGPRGAYSGTLGYLGANGAAQLNIVIRTIVLNGGELTIGTGGAITILSDPQAEFEETLLKVHALLNALRAYAAVELPADADEMPDAQRRAVSG